VDTAPQRSDCSALEAAMAGEATRRHSRTLGRDRWLVPLGVVLFGGWLYGLGAQGRPSEGLSAVRPPHQNLRSQWKKLW